MAIVVHYAPQTRAVTTIWALEELGIPYEKVQHDLQKGDHKTDAFRKLNPNCKVPTVVFDGTPMFESLAILLYLGERYGVDKKLFPAPSDAARIEAMSWGTWATVTLGADVNAVDLARFPRIGAYFERLKSRPAFVRAMA